MAWRGSAVRIRITPLFNRTILEAIALTGSYSMADILCLQFLGSTGNVPRL